MTGRRLPCRRHVAEPFQNVAAGDVHVDDEQMGPPVRQRRRAASAVVVRTPRGVAAVTERELDQLGEHRLVDHQ